MTISIPANTKISSKMKELIVFFNNLERKLAYPNCEGYAEQRYVLERAEQELIKWGKL